MFDELDRIIANKAMNLERLKQGMDVPLVSEDRYFLTCRARNSLQVGGVSLYGVTNTLVRWRFE